MKWLWMLALACAPSVDGPVEQQRARDRDDADLLAAQLAQLPGAVRADVTLHRAVADPLAHTGDPAGAAILVVVDDHADTHALSDAALQLARATAPDIPTPAIVVEVGAVRPELATVGPFVVEAGSRTKLKATLAALLALVLALAGYVILRTRK